MIELQVGRQALAEQPVSKDASTRLGGRTLRQQRADMRPHQFRFILGSRHLREDAIHLAT